MLFSVIFFIVLTMLVFVSFILLNKSLIQFEEKLTSKAIIIGLFALVVIMNQIQNIGQMSTSNSLTGVFTPSDLLQLPETNILDLNIEYNKTKGIYWIPESNTTLPYSMQLQLENRQRPYIHLNFDHYSALNVDEKYLNKKMQHLSTELQSLQMSQAVLIIKIEVINTKFTDYLENIFDFCNCSLVFYGSQIKELKHTMPSFFRYSQQLIL